MHSSDKKTYYFTFMLNFNLTLTIKTRNWVHINNVKHQSVYLTTTKSTQYVYLYEIKLKYVKYVFVLNPNFLLILSHAFDEY